MSCDSGYRTFFVVVKIVHKQIEEKTTEKSNLKSGFVTNKRNKYYVRPIK